jgi:hypothetical protein
MAKIDPPVWYNVNEDAQIWAGHADSAHKQGKLIAPAGILAIDEYQGSYQFKEVRVVGDGRDEVVIHPGYPDTWIRISDTSLSQYLEPGTDPVEEPDEEPDPYGWGTEIGDAELGAAIRVVVTKISSLIAPYFN